MFHQIFTTWPLGLINIDHVLEDFLQIIRIHVRYAVNVSRLYLLRKLDLIRSFEWRSERYDFIKHATSGPKITLMVVPLLLYLLW